MISRRNIKLEREASVVPIGNREQFTLPHTVQMPFLS
jgi:hypothetical protein